MFSKWPINLFFHQFWSQNSSRQKFFVEMMGPIRGLDWPASSGSTCGWSYRSLVEMVILRWKGSLNHFVWGCFGKGSPHPPENGGKKNTYQVIFRLGSLSSLQYLFVSFLLDHWLQWDSQNSTLKKKTNQRCKRRRSMLRIPILGVSWINYTPTQKSIRKMSCMMTPFRGHHRLQTLWLGLARWGRPEKRSLGAGWLRRPQGDPKWENSELDVFFEVDLRKVLCENRMKYVNTWIWWYVNVCVFFRKSCYKPKWEIAIYMLFIQGIEPHVCDT